jgi:putative NADH-flavin reductase
MNIVVFGASGATGRELVAQAIAQGHTVTAFVRMPGKLKTTHDRLKVHTGDIADARAVERAITGQQAVLCCLGAPSPMALYPPFTDGVKHIIHAMGLAAVRRLIYLSFIGVHASRAEAGFFVHRIATRILRAAIADHETNEQAIMQSRLDWTIVRAPKLTSGRRTGQYRTGEHLIANGPVQLMSRADVAEFMLRQLMDTALVRKAPSILR